MAFITRCCANISPELWLRALLAALLWVALDAPAQAEGFSVQTATAYVQEGSYRLNASVHYELSGEVLQALNNGVPLTLVLETRVQRVRPWWSNALLARQEQRHQLTFHAFSGQYLVRNLASDTLEIYPSLASALFELGTVVNLPLLPVSELTAGKDYEVQLRALLDIEALPAPLRPVAYVNPGWRLISEWFTCPLRP